MRSRALLAFTMVMLAAGMAAADPRIVLVETSDSPSLPALATQLQLHAGRPVIVTATQERSESSMTLAARASQIVTERDATIVVWVAAVAGQNGADRSFLVFAAGRWPGRALIELIRIDASTAPGEIERTIALKIAGLLDTVTAPRPMGVALGVPVDQTRHTTPWRLDVLGSLIREAGDRRWDGRIEVGGSRIWKLGAWRLAAGVGVHWQPAGAIEGAAGTVSLDELGAGIALAVERPMNRWSLFGRPRGSALLLIADGMSVNGVSGSAVVVSPGVGLDVGARWHLSDTVQIVFGAGIEAALIQQRFLVDGNVIADLRRIRGRAIIGLSISL